MLVRSRFRKPLHPRVLETNPAGKVLPTPPPHEGAVILPTVLVSTGRRERHAGSSSGIGQDLQDPVLQRQAVSRKEPVMLLCFGSISSSLAGGPVPVTEDLLCLV